MTAKPHKAHGFGLVELLLALTLGLWLIGMLIPLVMQQLAEQRHLLQGVRLTQDLRHATELMGREWRRSGFQGEAEQALWPAGAAPGRANPYAGLWLADDGRSLTYAYSRDEAEDHVASANEHFGLRLNSNSATLDLRLGGNTLNPGSSDQWQALTDPNQLRVTRLNLQVSTLESSLLDACMRSSCTAGSTTCPPRWRQQRVTVDLQAGASRDSSVVRSAAARATLRNAEVTGRCPD